ncbi:G domain-containing protein [Mycena venus]|uniref:G domain-containing protein n=1 Tax=Mycena venus TaxID=2733690 RepID=A0A8H6TZ48_9AGAR|nr:G domain-containing protein [Mycena venus]
MVPRRAPMRPPVLMEPSIMQLSKAPQASQQHSIDINSVPIAVLDQTDDPLPQIPRFRLLVVGRAGSGKSSLISHAFGVEVETISEYTPTYSDIETEIKTPNNDRFRLHDSMGIEPGDRKKFEITKRFFENRCSEDTPIEDRVHIVWLCIQIPTSGQRLFEAGDVEFLKLAFDLEVPILVVFTKFDRLVSRELMRTLDLLEPEAMAHAVAAAEATFRTICLEASMDIDRRIVDQYARTSGLGIRHLDDSALSALAGLIEKTRVLGKTHIEGVTWWTFAMAQRASVEQKIHGSIDIGMRRYWRGLASSTKFANMSLKKCLEIVHQDIIDSWNIYDPNHYLSGEEFHDQIKSLVQLVTPELLDSKLPDLDTIEHWLGLAVGPASPLLGPASLAIGLSAWFVKWATRIYETTPEVLRCFIGYIVDLTLILDEIFRLVISRRTPGSSLTQVEVNIAVETYRNTGMQAVHGEIRKYVNKATFAEILDSNKAEEKVKILILKYSSVAAKEKDTSD